MVKSMNYKADIINDVSGFNYDPSAILKLKNLLDHYFTSDKTKIYMGMTCIESGASSIHNKGTAFTIPLMDSGSIFDGYWGYVKGGIWKIIDEISEIKWFSSETLDDYILRDSTVFSPAFSLIWSKLMNNQEDDSNTQI